MLKTLRDVVNEDTYKYSARAVIDGYEDNDMPSWLVLTKRWIWLLDMVKMVIIKNVTSGEDVISHETKLN
ncbi:MAG: hypothetical protein ACLTAI_01780 [Thomasclavelia sp.]